MAEFCGSKGVKAIPWVSRFLAASDDAAGEAALAIAATHSAEGLHVLQEALEKARDPWFRSVLLSAIALTRQEAAMDFLLGLVATESRDAEGALEAIVRAMPSGRNTCNGWKNRWLGNRDWCGISRRCGTHRGEPFNRIIDRI